MYKDYYQFKFLPFNMSPDPRFYFASKGHNKAMSYMQYGLSQGEGFIVITGDIGTGKTTIVKHLLSELDSSSFIAKQLVSTYLDTDDLLAMVCESFELPFHGRSKSDLLSSLKQYFMNAYKYNRRIVLIVDEVQNLPLKTVEELRMLSNFQVNNQPLLQTFLVGQKEFIPTLQSEQMEQLRQRVIASAHLGPLKQEETEEYINYRLHEAGWTKGALFTHEACLLTHELTEGVPRRINVFCDRVLLYCYLEEKMPITVNEINAVADELENEITSPVKKRNFNDGQQVKFKSDFSDSSFHKDKNDFSYLPPVSAQTTEQITEQAEQLEISQTDTSANTQQEFINNSPNVESSHAINERINQTDFNDPKTSEIKEAHIDSKEVKEVNIESKIIEPQVDMQKHNENEQLKMDIKKLEEWSQKMESQLDAFMTKLDLDSKK